jgi:hypothetical protein
MRNAPRRTRAEARLRSSQPGASGGSCADGRRTFSRTAYLPAQPRVRHGEAGNAVRPVDRSIPRLACRSGIRVAASAAGLPARIQQSYFMLSSAERDLLNTALEKFRPGRHEPVLVGGLNRPKTALKLMGLYRLVIEKVQTQER